MTSQSDFHAALLDPAHPVPNGLVDPQGRTAQKRFDVYRNNVAVSLGDALVTAFPVIHKLLGDDFFRALAGVYLRQYPPRSPVMMFYGSDMPAFLQSFAPVAHLPYLPDVARLEIAIREAYHEADSTALSPEALGSLSPDELLEARFRFAPAMRIVRSDWPIHAIWQFNLADGPKPDMRAEDVLVFRPDLDPEQALLPEGAAEFITALRDGDALGTAYEEASQRDSAFDLGATLGVLMAASAITKFTIGPKTWTP